MRYEVEHGPAIARHNDCLAVFYVTGKLGKPILRIADLDALHTLIVATSGYRVKIGRFEIWSGVKDRRGCRSRFTPLA